MSKLACLILLVTVNVFVWASPQDRYPFETEAQSKRFTNLTQQLRCVVCQNQSLAESNAPLANDLRTVVYEQIQQGATDENITQFLVQRYGDFVLYQPPFNATTALLWLFPIFLLVVVLVSVSRKCRSH